ncbi:LmeA family phospholipid-binding protein [Corynebacterium doosanense]|uniref:LmeA family phospholipid-binding protein n=1 Tax=Corynebacterium doosanense TaxID=1121358 RepID=UPI001FE16E7D|nr:DUF2993 domain-containing protein [Corynebacterium doosanense]
MSTPESTRRRLSWRTASVASVAGVAVLAWVVDSVAATRVEARISSAVEKSADLDTSPDAYVGGQPYLLALATNEIPTMSVESLDISVEGLGIVNARTELSGIDVTPRQVVSGDLAGAPAELYKRVISLDGVAFGQLLGITDLDISNPYDISPGGGVASEALLTGTPEGFSEPVSALVNLRLDGPIFRMSVRELVSVPPGREADATAAFTFTMDTRHLPLSQQAAMVQMRGGSIMFETERQNITVELADLAPLDTGDAGDPETAAWEQAEPDN